MLAGHKKNGSSFVKAFTLIELLVVIAIIALLVSILLPSLNKARDLAKGAICISNLKSVGTAFGMYMSDGDDWYPMNIGVGDFGWPSGPANSVGTIWYAYIAVYLGWNGDTSHAGFTRTKLLDCPLYTPPAGKYLAYDSTSDNWGYNAYGYNYNGFGYWNFSNPAQSRRFKGAQIVQPAEKILVADAGPYQSTPNGGVCIISYVDITTYPVSTRHTERNPDGGPDILFADGHVNYETLDEVNGLDYTAWTTAWWNKCVYRYWVSK